MEIGFNDETAKNLNKGLNDYLFSFAQDDFVENKPNYRKKRYGGKKVYADLYNRF